MLVDRRDNVVKALVLGNDNSLIPVEISCNEMHKYISTGYSETIIIKYPYLKGILDFNRIRLIHAFMLHIRTYACTIAHMQIRTHAHIDVRTHNYTHMLKCEMITVLLHSHWVFV